MNLASNPPEAATATSAREASFRLIAPLGTGDQAQCWLGRSAKKSWEYRSTAIIPHLDTIEMVEALVPLLRMQTEPCYMVFVDTGSPPAVCDRLEAMRADDIEVHFVRANDYGHSSEPVCVALDLGFARASSELIFLTHTDCFPLRRDLLAWLGAQVSLICPVVGWQMSERSWVTNKWQGVVSHTCTMLHSQTMRRIGATWHMQRFRDAVGSDASEIGFGWPDTETSFDMCLKAAGIRPKLIGCETNYRRQVTDWWDHARSYTGAKCYVHDPVEFEIYAHNASVALAEAKARGGKWITEASVTR